MQQSTLTEHESTDRHECPTCSETFDSRQGVSTHHHMGHDRPLSEAEVEEKYGVPYPWILNTLHNILEMSVNEISNHLEVSRKAISNAMDDRYDIPRRDQSEAEQLKWDQMSPKQRQQQVEQAHQRAREMAEAGEHPFQKIWKEDPEKARQRCVKNGALGAPARETNGMEGVTGQDHPQWVGGTSIYEALKKSLGDYSWEHIREEARKRDDRVCQMCGGTNPDPERRLDVHHIIPVMAGGTNDDWCLMSLCTSCHQKTERYIRYHIPEIEPCFIDEQ